MLARWFCGIVAAMLFATCAGAGTGADDGSFRGALKIDSSAARATLDALDNPALTLDEARIVARLPGNQGLIRKAVNYGRSADEASFAAALVAAAHGDAAAPDPSQFHFTTVRKHKATLRSVMAAIEDPAAGLIDAATRRIALYTPATATRPITGYLVVGGTSGGFAFGDPAFFLNLDYYPDAVLATTILQHELYHAVQGSALPGPAVAEARKRCLKRLGMPAHMDDLFNSLFAEGSASAVGDVLALPKDATGIVGDERKNMQRNVNRVSRAVTLLELSSHALATQAVDFDSIYELGFYGDEILYALGYVMAKAIEQEHGAPAIADITRQSSGTAFIDRYRQLAAYGKATSAPALGPKTLNLAKRMVPCAR